MKREVLLAQTLVELTDTLVEDFDVDELLTTLTFRCVEILDVAAAGIMLATDGGLRLVTSTSDEMETVELFELQAHEGPCLDCFHSGQPVVDGALAIDDRRWPRFTPVALGAGFRAADAVPMRLRGEVIGAVNLFRVASDPMSDDDIVLAQALAGAATIAVLHHRALLEAHDVSDQLQRALTSRVVIEQAKGVISQGLGVDVENAFTLLRRHSRNNNERLADAAARIVAGALSPSQLDEPRTTDRSSNRGSTR